MYLGVINRQKAIQNKNVGRIIKEVLEVSCSLVGYGKKAAKK